MGDYDQDRVNCVSDPAWLERNWLLGDYGVARFWLIKTEPAKYSWQNMIDDGETIWDGVRNHRAKNNLAAMEKGDLAFFYHSVVGKEIVGIVQVSESGLTDPTDPEGKWAAVKFRPVRLLKKPVTLKEIKGEPSLAAVELIRLSRLSVAELLPSEWDIICRMGDA